MMKRIISVLLTVAMLLSFCCVAHAETWTCPACGTANEGNFCSQCGEKKPVSEWTCPACGTVNSGNFCSGCGAKRPDGGEVAGGIYDVRCEDMGDGHTRISWNDPANAGPYTITYKAAEWIDYSTNYGEDPCRGTSCSVICLIPGVSYTITVSNGYSSASAEYTPPKASFTDFKSNKEIKISKSYVEAFGEDYNSSFKMDLYHAKLSQNRIYAFLLAVRTPMGYCSYIETYEELELEARYIGRTGYHAFAPVFDAVKACFGKIPTGKYYLEAYLGGKFYATVSFDVRGN